mgnify:FL=1
MGETTEYKLSDLFNLQMGKTPSRNNAEFWSDGEYKWISIADLTKTGKYISETKELLSQKAIDESGIAVIPTNTVVMSFKLSIGKTAITSEDMYSNEAIMSFHDRHVTELLPEYIYYLLLAQRWDEGANKAVMGMTQNKATLSNRKVRIHSIIAQKSIVERLDKLQKLIDDRKTQLDELETLIKARFVEMFGDPIQNEKNWSRRSLEQLCHSIVDCPHSTPNYISEDTGFMCIRTSVVKKNKILWDEIEYIVEDEFNQRIQRKRPEKGDIVYTREGAILGIAAIIDRNCNVALGQRSMLLSPDSSVCTSEFICTAMNSDSFLSNALRGISGSASPHINVGDIKSFEMIAPPLELQRKFSEFNSQVDKLKVEVQSIFLNCGSRSIFRYAQSIKGCKIEKYERRCSFDTKRECHRGNEKKWWICYLSAIKSDC